MWPDDRLIDYGDGLPLFRFTVIEETDDLRDFGI